MRNVYAAIQVLLLGAALGCAGLAGAQAAPAAQEGAETGPGTDAEAEAGPDQAGPEPEPEPVDLSATGDGWVDAQLVDIGRYGRRHREAFIDELVRYREAPRALVEALLDVHGWAPGDVYFACSLAGVTGRSCRFVVDRRGQPPGTGWNALATELGAGTGSEGFARIRHGIVHSYRRWARPLRLDATLAEAFPDHEGPPPQSSAAADGG